MLSIRLVFVLALRTAIADAIDERRPSPLRAEPVKINGLGHNDCNVKSPMS